MKTRIKYTGAARALMTMLTAALTCLGVSADGVSPATGEKANPLPFILAGVAVVLIVALVVLSLLSKKKK